MCNFNVISREVAKKVKDEKPCGTTRHHQLTIHGVKSCGTAPRLWPEICTVAENHHDGRYNVPSRADLTAESDALGFLAIQEV